MATKNITSEQFRELIFDHTTEKEWNFKGSVPAIVDFYADWCGPCKMVAPILEQLSEEYAGKLDIYKVNTDVQMEVSTVFGIQSIPTLLFIPVTGAPSMEPGAFPKHVLKQIIEEHLLSNNPVEETE